MSVTDYTMQKSDNIFFGPIKSFDLLGSIGKVIEFVYIFSHF